MTPAVARALEHTARAALAGLSGQYVEAARELAGAALELVPEPVARQLLTDEAVRRANRIADEAERVKFLTLVKPEDDGPEAA